MDDRPLQKESYSKDSKCEPQQQQQCTNTPRQLLAPRYLTADLVPVNTM